VTVSEPARAAGGSVRVSISKVSALKLVLPFIVFSKIAFVVTPECLSNRAAGVLQKMELLPPDHQLCRACAISGLNSLPLSGGLGISSA
jgi:hypothetical protein